MFMDSMAAAMQLVRGESKADTPEDGVSVYNFWAVETPAMGLLSRNVSLTDDMYCVRRD